MSATEENTNMILPCVLVTSCDSEFKEEELIKQIIGSETLPQTSERDGTVAWYPWTINNKYYTADVRLCAVPNTYAVSSEIAQSMQAFIAYFDSKVTDGLEKLKPWIPVVEDITPEVLILVCDRTDENGVTKHEAQQWCLGHAFELVELNPLELPDEDGHNQGFGLMSSLVASRHNSRRCQDPPSSSLPEEGTLPNDTAEQRENTTKADRQEDSVVDAMTDLDIQELANLTAGDADVDNFERLFTKLKEMKDKASSLPHEQRKVHAEKVAKAFWMAIGGDEDEIDGLSSGEES
uniref:Alpha and gamma adaptin binding protein n=1 Tax=Kryptolebias marmoratus TaxID=37003 RepID=A0A3Q3BA10_KRYMA